jgi:hypothetical protein
MDKSSWTHPTPGALRAPRRVTLVSLGPSREEYCMAMQEPEPAFPPGDEVWTLNRGVWHVPHDLLFVMDHIQGEADHYPEYGARLWRHNRPIITSDTAGGWPAHVHRFPFEQVQAWLRDGVNPVHGDWFHNSLAYILVYAAFIGVRELTVWGADYHHHRSGRVEDGHPNVAYWAGVLERVGLTVRAPSASTFLNANQRGYIYGYRDDPRDEARARRERFINLVS